MILFGVLLLVVFGCGLFRLIAKVVFGAAALVILSGFAVVLTQCSGHPQRPANLRAKQAEAVRKHTRETTKAIRRLSDAVRTPLVQEMPGKRSY